MFGSGNEGFPFSRRNLQRFAQYGFEYEYNEKDAIRDVSFQTYDFTRSVAADITNTWTVAAGGTATSWAALAEAGGWVRGVTGTTTASAGLQMYAPAKMWTGAANCGMAVLYRPSVVEGITFEMGFVNALPSVNSTVVNNATTPTFNTSVDVAMMLYQHAGNATALPDRVGLYTNNSSSGTAQKSVLTLASLGAKTGPAAATPHMMAIEIVGTTVSLWMGDAPAPITLTSAVTAANGLIPFISVKGTNSTSKNFDVDMISVWSGRLG